ncbi:C-terminal binding protein [Halalkalibaculum sp. DA3122]|uniref:C-terminal binding protein n=1 Tax=unclassified Halalkalibaculum TaxID=2964617 RepID=UPI0037552210
MTDNDTTTPKIALLDPGIASCSYEETLFTEHGYHFEVFEGEKGDYQSKINLASDAEGILIRFTEIDDRFLEQTPNLKAVARYGVGYDNIDVDACTRFGVRCANVRGYGNHSVSDHALALILACVRMLKPGYENIYTRFGGAPSDRVPELHELVLGILGLGRIGGTLAQKAGSLFKSVIACDPYVEEQQFERANAQPVSYHELLQTADVISIHCNLTEETRHLINKEAFDQMERGPILVNTARGEVVDEEALLEALESGSIHSAGLDVFKTELPDQLSRRLVEHPRVMATGHYAWFSDRAQDELQKRTADNLLAMLQGQNPEDCLNPF